MLEFIGWILLAIIAGDYGNYYKQTKDGSIQGFLEYMKDRYYTKHEKPKPEPKPGSTAHYEAWRAEKMKNKR